MASCDYCGSYIMFGGVKEDGFRFCNDNCHGGGALLKIADEVPEDELVRHMVEVHQGECPKCGGAGPIDVHTSHMIWSAILLTSWYSKPQVSCRMCGIKSKLGGAFLSGVVGWWGFPWGIIMTPVQVSRNMLGLFFSPSPNMPSDQLQKLIKLDLAAHIVEHAHQEVDLEEEEVE